MRYGRQRGVFRPEGEEVVSSRIARPQREQNGPTAQLDQLRAALRLLFDDRLADQITLAAMRSGEADLGRAMRLARRQYTLQRFHRSAGTAPLRPRLTLSALDAIPLALHLGLELDAETLGRLFGAEPERIALGIDRARRVIDPRMPQGCGFCPNLPRYRDPLDPASRMALVAHLQTCPDCREAIDAREAVDRKLLDALRRPLVPLPAELPPLQAWRWRAVWLGAAGGAVLLLTAMVVAATVVVSRVHGSSGSPVPLLSGETAGQARGWLVQTAGGALIARNLATGEQRPIALGVPLDEQSTPYLSPDGRLAAIWRAPSGQGYAPTLAISQDASLAVSGLDGTLRWQHTFESADVSWIPVGWLDDRTFLLNAAPRSRFGESRGALQERTGGQVRLVAVDAATGSQRDLFQGDDNQVYPSPDGTLVALAAPSGQPEAGRTLELRPVTPEGLGPPLFSLERGLLSDVAWAPDSSRLFITEVSDEAPRPSPPTGAGAPFIPAQPNEQLGTVTREGQEARLPVSSTTAALSPLLASADGQTLIYQTVERDYSLQTSRLWRISLDGAQPVDLLGRPADGVTRPVVPPSAEHPALLAMVRPAYLDPSASPGSSGSSASTELISVEPDWRLRALETLIGSPAQPAIGWLPEDALPPRNQGTTADTTIGTPEPVDGLVGYHIDAESGADPLGRHIVVQGEAGQAVAVVASADGSRRPLTERMQDLGWTADGQAAIGVSTVSQASQDVSRIVLYAAESESTNAQAIDGQTFDPARMGTSTTRRYARPLVSPDGNHTAFLVVDRAQQTAALWLSGWDQPPREVDSWSYPSQPLDEVPLEVAWVDGETLLAARPDSWQNGLPQQIALERIHLSAAGTVDVTPLVALAGAGNDYGIVLADLTVSPDHAHIAYRLRHYTKTNVAEHYDTIDVAPTSNLRQRLEISRGSPGEGIAWAPDSHRLAAGLRGQLRIYAIDGLAERQVSPDGAWAGDPVWLGDQLWFTMDGDGGRRVWHVRVS